MALIDRRSLSALAVGAVVSAAAITGFSLGGGTSPAGATTADGDVVLGVDATGTGCTPGSTNCATAPTGIENAGGGTALLGQSNGGGDGVDGGSDGGGDGVFGSSDTADGVLGESSSGDGVRGNSGSGIGVYAASSSHNQYALFATADNASGGHIETQSQFGAGLEVAVQNTGNVRGALEAQTNGGGQAVLATAVSGSGVEGHSTSGTGVLGVADSGKATALKAQGKTTLSGPSTLAGTSSFTGTTSFARSGKLTIPAGAAQATKSGVALTSASLVLATIQGNVAGVYVQGVTDSVGTSGSFTIHLNKATPSNVAVAWFIVN